MFLKEVLLAKTVFLSGVLQFTQTYVQLCRLLKIHLKLFC